MKNKLLSFLFLLTFIYSSHNLSSQTSNNSLSKEEMYSDFDFFLNLINQSNPHLPIYKGLMHYDVIKEMKKNRKLIKSTHNIGEFYSLLRNTITLLPENHSRFLTHKDVLSENNVYKPVYPNYFDSTTIINYKKVKNAASDFATKDENLQLESKRCNIEFCYIDGKFFTLQTIKITSLESNITQTIPAMCQLIKINGMSVKEFLRKNISSYTFTFNVNRFDIKHNLKYNDELLMNNVLFNKAIYISLLDSNKNEFKIKIETIDHKNSRIYGNDYKISCQKILKKPENKVLYFDSILYIRMIAMKDSTFFKREIPIYRGKPIKKVVIDVRNNGGGSDNVWHSTLGLIIDTTFCRHQTMAITNSNTLEKFINTSVENLELYHDKLLNKDYRLIDTENHCFQILPAKNSLNYTGKIYVLHNRYSFSAAMSLVAFALGNSRVVAVGENNGFLGGYGASPFLFQLPFSKFIFVMHSTIHLPVKPKKLEDYFWNKTEIEVKSTPLFESLMYKSRFFDLFSEDFLLNNDIYFRKVLDDK